MCDAFDQAETGVSSPSSSYTVAADAVVLRKDEDKVGTESGFAAEIACDEIYVTGYPHHDREELEFQTEPSNGAAACTNADSVNSFNHCECGGTAGDSSDESFEEVDFSPDEIEFDESNAAFEGVKLVLSGTSLAIAESHFQSFKIYSAPMANGYSFVHVVKAILSQDTAHIVKARAVVKECESMYKQIRNCKHSSEFAKLYASVCQADAYLFKASLLLIKFEISVALQCGWYVRKAAKLFHQNEVALMKLKQQRESQVLRRFTPSAGPTAFATAGTGAYDGLYAAVCFGVGFTNLLLSILPPSYASVMNVMGYESDRVKGLKNLDLCRRGNDFHSPLASLILLWYYLIAKPLMCCNKEDLEVGFSVAEEILTESPHALSECSWIVHFFKGKLSILRKNDVEDGLRLYMLAKDSCCISSGESDLEKLRVLLVFEIGWCWVIKCHFRKAVEHFSTIKDCSYWSEGLYLYANALCVGVLGGNGSKQALSMIKRVAMIKKKHPNNSEFYVISRAKLCYNIEKEGDKKEATLQSHLRLLIFEMLYFWNHLNLLSEENRTDAIEWMGKLDQFDRKLRPMANLLCGALQTISSEYHSAIDTLTSLRAYLSTVQKSSSHSSFSLEKAYGLYELALAKYKLMLLLHSKSPPKFSSATTDEVEELLSKTMHFSGYQFENRLKLRVHSLRADVTTSSLESSSSSSSSTAAAARAQLNSSAAAACDQMDNGNGQTAPQR